MTPLLHTLLAVGPATIDELCEQAKLDREQVCDTLEHAGEFMRSGDYRNESEVWICTPMHGKAVNCASRETVVA